MWETLSSQVVNIKSVQLFSLSFFKKYVFRRFLSSQQLSSELQQHIKLSSLKGNLRIKENWHLSWFKNGWNDSSGKKMCGKKWGLSKTSGVCKQWDKLITSKDKAFLSFERPFIPLGMRPAPSPIPCILCFWGTRVYTTFRVQGEKRKKSSHPKLILSQKENKIKSI